MFFKNVRDRLNETSPQRGEEWRGETESSKEKHLEGPPDGMFINSTSALHIAQYMYEFFNTLKPRLINNKSHMNMGHKHTHMGAHTHIHKHMHRHTHTHAHKYTHTQTTTES